jgi:hypothetical protein
MRFDFSDVLIVAGAGMVLVGIWLIYPLATLIVGGLFLLAIGLARAINKGKKQ